MVHHLALAGLAVGQLGVVTADADNLAFEHDVLFDSLFGQIHNCSLNFSNAENISEMFSLFQPAARTK